MKSLFSKNTNILVSSILLTCVAFSLIPAGSVFASTPADDTTPPPSAPQGEKKPLDQAFKLEQKAHEHQEEMITKAVKGSSKLSELIARAKANGKDTASLEKALADFNTLIGGIRLEYDKTGKLIKEHVGFDADGKVVDRDQARKTVEAIHKGNQNVRKALTAAVKDLRAAGEEFRKANPRPTEKPASQPS